MQIDLAVLADAATIDGAGKLNILGIFDRIGAAEFPARHERMCLVFRINASIDEVGEHEVGIAIVSPSGDEVSRMDGMLRIGPQNGGGSIRIPQVVHLDGFVFPEPGSYSIDISLNGEIVESLDLFLSGAGKMAQA